MANVKGISQALRAGIKGFSDQYQLGLELRKQQELMEYKYAKDLEHQKTIMDYKQQQEQEIFNRKKLEQHKQNLAQLQFYYNLAYENKLDDVTSFLSETFKGEMNEDTTAALLKNTPYLINRSFGERDKEVVRQRNYDYNYYSARSNLNLYKDYIPSKQFDNLDKFLTNLNERTDLSPEKREAVAKNINAYVLSMSKAYSANLTAEAKEKQKALEKSRKDYGNMQNEINSYYSKYPTLMAKAIPGKEISNIMNEFPKTLDPVEHEVFLDNYNRNKRVIDQLITQYQGIADKTTMLLDSASKNLENIITVEDKDKGLSNLKLELPNLSIDEHSEIESTIRKLNFKINRYNNELKSKNFSMLAYPELRQALNEFLTLPEKYPGLDKTPSYISAVSTIKYEGLIDPAFNNEISLETIDEDLINPDMGIKQLKNRYKDWLYMSRMSGKFLSPTEHLANDGGLNLSTLSEPVERETIESYKTNMGIEYIVSAEEFEDYAETYQKQIDEEQEEFEDYAETYQKQIDNEESEEQTDGGGSIPKTWSNKNVPKPVLSPSNNPINIMPTVQKIEGAKKIYDNNSDIKQSVEAAYEIIRRIESSSGTDKKTKKIKPVTKELGDLQIRPIYVNDVNRIMNRWNGIHDPKSSKYKEYYKHSDAGDSKKSKEMFEIYMGFYLDRLKKAGKSITIFEIARIHNGGPNWRSSPILVKNTEAYVKKINNIFSPEDIEKLTNSVIGD